MKRSGSKDIWWLAKGTCTICEEEDADLAGNQEDAHLFLNQSHGFAQKHCFSGDVAFEECNPPRSTRLRQVA